MKIKTLFLLCLAIACLPASAAVFSGANVPFDSSFHLGLVSGPGTGVSIGADMFYPVAGFNLGGEIEQQITNADMDQNINILKYGVGIKYVMSDDFYLSIYLGRASFFITKYIEYNDSFSGATNSIDENTHGSATYLAVAPNFHVWDFYLTPKIVLNNIADGGTIAEFDLNLGHQF